MSEYFLTAVLALAVSVGSSVIMGGGSILVCMRVETRPCPYYILIWDSLLVTLGIILHELFTVQFRPLSAPAAWWH